TLEHYRQYHHAFIEKRIKVLQSLVARRKAFILPMQKGQGGDRQTQYFSSIQQGILGLHQAHSCTEMQTQLQVSFGVVRV
ncbi:hypothetical protein, partial [Escherichia coli]